MAVIDLIKNEDISSYMDRLEKAELTALMCHVARFLKRGIPIHNSEVPDTAGRKTRKRRRRTEAIAKRFAFHANPIRFFGTDFATDSNYITH